MLICLTPEELAEKYIDRANFNGVAQSEARKNLNLECLEQAIEDELDARTLYRVKERAGELRSKRLSEGPEYQREAFANKI